MRGERLQRVDRAKSFVARYRVYDRRLNEKVARGTEIDRACRKRRISDDARVSARNRGAATTTPLHIPYNNVPFQDGTWSQCRK